MEGFFPFEPSHLLEIPVYLHTLLKYFGCLDPPPHGVGMVTFWNNTLKYCPKDIFMIQLAY